MTSAHPNEICYLWAPEKGWVPYDSNEKNLFWITIQSAICYVKTPLLWENYDRKWQTDYLSVYMILGLG